MDRDSDYLLKSRFCPDVAHDRELGTFFRSVYIRIATGLMVSGAAAWAVGNVPDLVWSLFAAGVGSVLLPTPLGLALIVAPLVPAMIALFAKRPSWLLETLYWAFAVLAGASIGMVTIVIAGTLATSAFTIAALATLAPCLWSRVLHLNLEPLHALLVTGLGGLILIVGAALAFQDATIDFLLNFTAVALLSALIGADVMRMRGIYFEPKTRDSRRASAAYAALTLPRGLIEVIASSLTKLGR